MNAVKNSSNAQLIDHTLLKADAKPADFTQLCHEAVKWGFYSVCVPPDMVSYCKPLLENSYVKVCTVIGFPLGANLSLIKQKETELAFADGAEEFDMVMNIHQAKSQNWQAVEEDIRAVVAASQNLTVKVILETHFLTEEEKVNAAKAVVAAGAHFVKTSTGFTGGGATIEDVILLRKTVGPGFGVKASGGVRDQKTFEAMIQAGANRIGTSSGVAILEGQANNEQSKGSY